MAPSNSRNLAVAPEQCLPVACATCCHYRQAPQPPKAPPKKPADIHGFFIAAVVAVSTLLMFSTANATFPTPSADEVEGDIRESVLPYGDQ